MRYFAATSLCSYGFCRNKNTRKGVFSLFIVMVQSGGEEFFGEGLAEGYGP